MSWYYYLEDKLTFPFYAKTINERNTSSLKLGEIVQVSDMAPAEDCEHDMFVMVSWQAMLLAVPLSQLKPLNCDDDTQQGISDWQRWIQSGHTL